MGQRLKIDKERLVGIVDRVPAWLPTIVCLLAIGWMTLSPKPLGDVSVPLFEGADKLAHGVMFFGLTLCVLFDTLHARGCRRLGLPAVAVIAVVCMGIGVGVEFLQAYMDDGRSFEFLDMVADAFGAILAGALWIILDNAYFKV